MVSDTSQFKGGQKVLHQKKKKKCTDYIEKWPFIVIFLYDLLTFLYIFVSIKNEKTFEFKQ